MTAFLLCIVSPVLLGYALLRLLAHGTGTALQIFLGAGIGAGLLSCFFFLSLVMGVPPLPIETPALAAAILVICLKRRESVPTARHWTPVEKFLAAAFGFAAIVSGFGFTSAVIAQPHGGWDGWMIWNMRARFLATQAWHDGFTAVLFYTHPDYPLLLPGFIARVWKVTGSPVLLAPALAAALFTSATVAVLVASLSALKGRAHGFLAGILLISTHLFAAQGAAEYADVPMSFFLLAALAMQALSEAGKRQPGFPILTGLAVGLAAWTKNEGWVLVAAFAILGTAALLRRRPRPLSLTAAGMLPVLATVLYFKVQFAAANDFIGGRTLHSYVVLLTGWPRYRELLRGLVNALVGPTDHNFAIPALGLAICAACLGFDRNRPPASFCIAILIIVFAGYCFSILISPYAIGWQVATALDRLLLQLLPAVLFTAFLMLGEAG